MTVQVIDNFLESELFDEINDLSVSSLELTYQSSDSWEDHLNSGTDKVLTHKIYDRNTGKKLLNDFYSDLTNSIIDKFKEEYNLNLSALHFYYWKKGSLINFHSDFTYEASATLYLNEEWDKDWGGMFIWDENEELNNHRNDNQPIEETNSQFKNINTFKAVLPVKNRCVINSGRILHAVTPTQNHSEGIVRRTVQMRFNNE